MQTFSLTFVQTRSSPQFSTHYCFTISLYNYTKHLQSRTVLLIWWGWRGGASSSFSYHGAETETLTAIMYICKSLKWSLHHGYDEEGKWKEVHAPSSFISLPHNVIWFNISTERNSSLKILLFLLQFFHHPYTPCFYSVNQELPEYLTYSLDNVSNLTKHTK